MTFRNLTRLGALAVFTATALSAQNKAPSKMLRTADGHPDLQGIWNNSTRTPLERPAEFAGKATLTDADAKVWEQKEHQAWQDLDGTSEGPLHKTKGSEGTGAYNVLFYDMGSGLARVDGVKRTSMVIDPPDGKIPPLIQQARERNRAAAARSRSAGNVKDRGLSERCIYVSMAGPPMLPTLYNNNYQIVQTPDTIMILAEEIHDVRIIRMNAQHAPENVRQWLGDSVGHWEGDTLVVETTNFTDQTRFRGSSKDLKVTERFTRVDANNIVYKATVEDPSTWTKPWTVELPFAAAPGPIYEYACHEGNYAIEDILEGARKADAEDASGKK
ncbi:MAG TPA: hypothetical protein VK776_10070 [Bryobacteraceae bacterium]|nr:hypothetical protein [Bryobacteraceae bacterium]